MIQPTYHFSRIHHPILFAHSLLIGLTPLIPIPFVDDWVKSGFQRRMVRQITGAYGISLTTDEVETLLQEDFWDSCIGGCVMTAISLLRRIFRKILFIFEIRRGFNLFSQTYYTGFLLEAALMDGYVFGGQTAAEPAQRVEAARRLREAIRRTRYAANFKYVQRILRDTIRPLALLRAGWLLVRSAVGHLPGVLAALPRAYINNIRQTPRRIQEGARSTVRTVRGIPGTMADLYARVQVLLSGENLLSSRVIEQMSKALEAALLRLPSDHFDALRSQLAGELKTE